jgi:hypothetical protein
VPLAEPPDRLSGFPRAVVAKSTVLARIHRAETDPLSFSTSGAGRFDVRPAGTLYLAATDDGAFLEVFRGSVVPAEEVSARRIAFLEVRRELELADVTSRSARRFGVTAAIHASPDYELCRRWAAAFEAERFDGIHYRLSHDPSSTETGVAFFGPPRRAAGRLRTVDDQPIGDELVERVRKRFGIVVVPSGGRTQ